MSWDDRNPQRDDPPEALDALLRSAQWPEVESDRVDRLQKQWSAISPSVSRRHRRRRVAIALAVAASLLMGVAIGWLIPKSQQQEELAIDPSHRPAPKQTSPAPQSELAPSRVAVEVPTSRPPTRYEELLARTSRRIPRETPDARMAVLKEAIDQSAGQPGADLDEIVQPLLADREYYEKAILWTLQQPSDGARQAVAIELLGRIGSARCVPALIELGRRPATHTPAVRALARLADPALLGKLAILEPDQDLRQTMVASLIARGDRRSLGVLLSLVADQATYESAVLALEEAEDAPVDGLLAFFHSPRQGERFAAALALGHLNADDVPDRLMAMVMADSGRREALLALASCDDRQATLFMHAASRDPSLRGLVLAAHHQVETLTPTPTEVQNR